MKRKKSFVDQEVAEALVWRAGGPCLHWRDALVLWSVLPPSLFPSALLLDKLTSILKLVFSLQLLLLLGAP